MAITQAEIIGIREAEQTDGATKWNYTSYSLLAFYDNQAPQLVEGKGYEVR